MKKLIKLDFNNTTRERKTEDSYSELYSHDKNNGSFEFEILNDTLTTEQVIALFKFTESNKIWKTTGTVEGNKVKVTFDTTLITQNETVICYLYFDEEQRTSDTFRFKFKVKVSEIDKMNRYEVKERFINNTVIVDRLDVVTKDELKEALKNVGGIATEGLLTEVKAEELYAKKSEAVDNTNFELVKNRVLALELKTDKDTVYDDSEIKGRISVLEAKEDNNTIYDDTNVRERLTALESKPNIDVNNLVTKDELASKNYLTEHQDTSNFALKSEIPQQYNDTEVKERLTTLENKAPVDLSGYATKEELRNVSGSQPLADNLVTKEELENKHYISDVSNLATKEELQEVRNSQPTVDTSHLVTRDELESKGYLTTHQSLDNLVTKQELEEKQYLTSHQDLSEYAKKSELYNDSDLKARVEVLEQKTDKDTVYDDTPLKERVTALESKAIEGGAYDDKPIRDRLDVLEAKHDNDTIYDDAEVKRRLTELEGKPAVDTSVFVTEEKLAEKGYLTSHQSLENLVTKEELNSKGYLTQHQDISNLATKEELAKTVTKDELEAKHFVTDEVLSSKQYLTEDVLNNKHYLTEHQSLENLVTKSELENKGYLTSHQDLSSYALKSEIPTPYNDTEVKQRLGVLEAKQDKDTVYNDEPIKERLTTLETKVDKDTVYNDSELRERVTNLENKPNVDLTNYVTNEQLENKHYLTQHQPLDNLVTKEELNSKGYVTEETLNSKGYLTEHQNISHLVTNDELNSKGYLTEEVLNSKNYLTEDVLNTKNYLTQHQDLSSLVTKQELENKHFLTEHQPLTHLATTSDLEVLRNISVNKAELSTKVNTTEFNTFKDNVVTKNELADKGYLTETIAAETYAKKSELPAPYNDSALVSRVQALETKQDNDTVYDDTKVKERLTALENRPSVSGGTQTQDTGWIKISDDELLHDNLVKIRRINDMVHVSLINTYNDELSLEVTDGNSAVLADKEIQKGFTPMKTIIVPITNVADNLSSNINVTGQAVFEVKNNRVTLKAYDNDISSGYPTQKHINNFSYFTEDPFPTDLH